MHRLLLFLFLFQIQNLVLSTNLSPEIQVSNTQNRVYICKGPDSYRYHRNLNCRGLNNCTAEVYEVTVNHARRLKRTPCKICLR
jgi:hypothetical protein